MDESKKIERFLENKLRNSDYIKTAHDFTKSLMSRIKEEEATANEELKREKIAKYIIGIFSFLTLVFTIIIGILSGQQPPTKTFSLFSIEPTIETSNNYLNQFFSFIEGFFGRVLSFLGLSNSPQTVTIIVGLLLAVTLFMLADKLFLKEKLKSR